MPPLIRPLLPLLLAVALAGCASVGDVRNRMTDGLRQGAEQAAEREASRQADRAVTAAFRRAEDAVVCLVTDAACIAAARRDGAPVVVEDASGEEVDRFPGAPAGFEPGDVVLFEDDWSGDAPGRVPARLEVVRGTWEVVETGAGRMLRTTGPRHAAVRIPLPAALPERFTVETEVFLPAVNQTLALATTPPDGPLARYPAHYVVINGNSGAGLDATRRSGLPTALNPAPTLHERAAPVRIAVDGDRVEVFVDGDRVGSLPRATLPRGAALYLENTYRADEAEPVYVGPIRVAGFTP